MLESASSGNFFLRASKKNAFKELIFLFIFLELQHFLDSITLANRLYAPRWDAFSFL